MAAACGPGGQTVIPDSLEDDDTTLGAGDVFAVRVYGQEDLSNSYRVAQDGSIDFPLVGRVEVGGREPTEIADLIAERLQSGQILVNPQVSVLVQEYNSKRISVMGAVSESGTFPMSAGLTVVQAISAAGGFTNLANRNGTVLTRRVDGELRRYNVRVDRISRGQEQDVPLRAGDIIYVPERAF
ncbi:MAG: polysaccharide biosynthesis/export family protein [Myxococcota bacterium]